MKFSKRAIACLCVIACTLAAVGPFSIATETARITPIEGCSLYVDRTDDGVFLCGVPFGSTNESIINLINGDCSVVSDGVVNTGDKVHLYSNGTIVDTATIVIDGDVNEDGRINGQDVVRIKKYMKSDIPVLRRAADINGDGVLDNNDITALYDRFDPQVTSTELAGELLKTNYTEGEAFSSKGLFVNVTYSDGTVHSFADGISVQTASNEPLLLRGDSSVTVTRGNITENIDINITPLTTFEARITKNNGAFSLGVADGGTNVLLKTTELDAAQIWTFTKQSNGAYEIKHKETGKCLDIAGGSSTSGTNVQIYADNDSNAQRWKITRNSNGVYELVSLIGTCKLALASTAADGVNVQMATASNVSSQMFDIEILTEAEKQIEAGPVNLGTNFIAEVTSVASGMNIQAPETNVSLEKKDNISPQLWRFEYQDDGSYVIINQHTGKAIDVYRAYSVAGTNVQTYAYSTEDKPNQRWFITEGSQGYVLTPQCSSRCSLDITNAEYSSGANIQLNTSTGDFYSQQFNINIINDFYIEYVKPISIGDDFRGSIRFADSVYATLSSTSNNLQIGTDCTDAHAIWRFARQPDGSYEIISTYNGVALDVSGNETANGTNVSTYERHDGLNQRWFIYSKEGNYILSPASAPGQALNVDKGSTTAGTNIHIWRGYAEETNNYFDFVEVTKTTKFGSASDESTWIYQDGTDGVYVRELNIDTDLGGPSVEIIQITDLHFNYCNAQDFAENNPVIMSTYKNRTWLANGGSVDEAQRCLAYAEASDQIVVTGDIYDYLSWGCIELTETHLFSKYPDVLACLGNHEYERQMQGEIEDTTSIASRLEIIKQHWINDIYYASRVIKDKVMVITLDNGQNQFWESQIPLLQADLEKARENGYVVLMFYHIQLSTGPNYDLGAYTNLRDPSKVVNFCYGGLVSPNTKTGPSRELYDLIASNGDIIKGCFCGHMHADYYTEIQATTPKGESTVIPQIVLNGAPYNGGNVLKITVN